jgi:hypothetical protein
MSEVPKGKNRNDVLSRGHEKLRSDREDRKAEELTPEARRELIKSEEVRRAVAGKEAREQAEKERIQNEADLEKGVRLDSKMEEVLAKPAFIVNKIHEENEMLAAMRTKGMSEPTEVNRSKEEEVTETSKELMPDIRLESSGRNEQMDEQNELLEQENKNRSISSRKPLQVHV